MVLLRLTFLAPMGLSTLVFLMLAACDDKAAATDPKADAPKTVEKIEGKLTVGGKEAKVTACKVKPRDPGTVLELTLDNGLTLVDDAMEGMFWQRDGGERTRLECDRMGGKSDAGSAFGSAWWTGELELECTHADGAIEAKLTLDCGAVNRPSNLVATKKK